MQDEYLSIDRCLFLFYGNVVVNSGVTIGEGRIIGSGSVITKDIWDWSEKAYRVIEESTD